MNKYLEKILKDNTSPIVFCYDGVLFEARWYERTIDAKDTCNENILKEMQSGKHLYSAPISFMMNHVNTSGKEVYVFAKIRNEIEKNFKNDQIKRFYSGIPERNIRHIETKENIFEYLEKIKEHFGCFTYVDDNYDLLVELEQKFGSNCNFFHISSFYVSENF